MGDEVATGRHAKSAPGVPVELSPRSDDRTTCLVKVLGVSRPVAVSGSREERISAVASYQRGRISRDQLLAAGVNDRAIYRLADKGHLRRRHRGVYTVGHDAPVPLGDETAALLACGDHAVLSHHSAAVLWQLLPEGDGRIHVTIRGRHGPCPDGVTVHRTNTLNRSEVRVVDGLPVTSPARTLIDAAPMLGDREFERAVDEALTQRLLTEKQLKLAAAHAGRRPGGAIMRALFDRRREPAITRSEAEERFLALIRAAQLPEPRVNVRVQGYEVDFHWASHGVVVEVQGYKFHSGRAVFERDTRKAAKLAAAGLTVCYVTWRQLTDEPYAVVARVAQTLAWAESRRAA